MATDEDVLGRLATAEAAGQVSKSAAEGIRRWLTEPPFATYRELLVADILAANKCKGRNILIRGGCRRHFRRI